MVVYTLVCIDCSHVFEVKLKMADSRDGIVCPECGGQSRRYIQSATPVQYNGTGFTRTEIPRKSGLEGYVS